MLGDHYATLGVAPNSSHALIRAAYVQLMRRYHPDKNPSAAAAARVRAITAAYAVLSMRDKRAQYDLHRTRVGVARSAFTRDRALWQRWLPLPIGIAAITLLVPLLLSQPLMPPTSTGRMPAVGVGQALAPQEPIETVAVSNARAQCTSPEAASLVRRELFRRAARLRGADGAAFDKISGYTLLRFASPVVANATNDPSNVNCNASVALDLPPGVAAHGGGRSVSGKIGYSLQVKGGAATRTIDLTTEDPLVELLATLAQTTSLQPNELDPSAAPNQKPREGPSSAQSAPLSAQPAAPVEDRIQPQRPVVEQSPSFSCRFPRNTAATSVCGNATLAALDREMASLYGDSMERADASKRALLLQSDRWFLARRDRCTSESCVHNAYLAGLQEIRNIRKGP